MGVVALRQVEETDLDLLFQYQRDPEAIRMAAFTPAEPDDRGAFDEHFARIRADRSVIIRTITDDGMVAGHIASFDRAGNTEVTYWVDPARWGKGIASAALSRFLGVVPTRPLHARVAKDNFASARVLRRCGFEMIGRDSGFAHGRGEIVAEDLFRLR